MKAFCLVLFAAVAMFGDTLVSDTPGGTSGADSKFFAFSWTQTDTWDNVMIQAPLESGLPNVSTGTAFLSNKLGSGATAANLLATDPISTNNNDPTALLTLFSGLTLGPGTYYVSLEENTGLYSIFGGSPVQTLGPDVTQNGDLTATGAVGSPAISTTFGASTETGHLLFTVTGDRVIPTTGTPEPSLTVFLALGLGGLAGVRRFGRAVSR